MAQVQNTANSPLSPERDAVDPELLTLPAPPRGRRIATLGLMAFVVAASMALVVSLRHDLAYFFSSAPTIELGDARAIDPATLRPNSQVRLRGTPMVSRAVRYRRVITGERYVVFPLAGQRTIYVQVEDREAAVGRSEFTGRLVTFDQLGGRVSSVRRYLAGEMALPVTGESFLLLADEGPASYGWALLLAALGVLFVIVDVVLLLRWFRPLPRSA